MKLLQTVCLAMGIALLCAGYGAAIEGHGPAWTARYVAAYEPAVGIGSALFSGDLTLHFNRSAITGTYWSTSIRPDPLRGHIVQVLGSVQQDGHVMLHIGPIWIPDATMRRDGTIAGTAHWHDRLWNFMAKVRP